MSYPAQIISDFVSLNLTAPILKALKALGYDCPSPIQKEAMPILLDGGDVLGQAQTGTGKTAAFALPALSKVNIKLKQPQVLILVPTRELAIQVADACATYGKYMHSLQILPIYGGQGYGHQLKTLEKGAHIVVGTPGRIQDHIRRGTLNLTNIHFVILDEADEMLRIGFLEDVDWILQHTPKQRQTALFSATMSAAIKKIAGKHMHNPIEININTEHKNAKNIRQKYWHVSDVHKLDGLTRILETEKYDGVIIFARTKNATTELAANLQSRGHRAVALNGDIAQRQRERIILDLKSGKINIIVATDVAARGLDVDRITHVINFDVPNDIESYIHRIGRTGRAGREGDAILFVSSKEKFMLKVIEQATKQKLQEIKLPTIKEVNQHRINKFKARIDSSLHEEYCINVYKDILLEYQKETNVDFYTIAAGLAHLLQDREPLLIKESDKSNQSTQNPFKQKDSKKRRSSNVQEIDFKNKKSKKRRKR